LNAGFKLQDGGRVDVESFKDRRRIFVTLMREASDPKGHCQEEFALTLSEARAVSSALMGAAAEL
jgi:hypothetical protein